MKHDGQWEREERGDCEDFPRTERFTVREECGVHLKDTERPKDLMFILGLNEAMDQLALVNSVR